MGAVPCAENAPQARPLGLPLAAAFAAACDELRIGSGTLIVACSGGADSAAALHLLRRARPLSDIVACYVDHGVRARPSVELDIATVRALASMCKARVHVSVLPTSPARGLSLEAALRRARYGALAALATALSARFVITGQHRDDLVESALLALVRGCGIDGLTAMRVVRPLTRQAAIARPLLFATKSQLEEYARSMGLPTSLDETNAEMRLRRNAVRVLLSGLYDIAPGASTAIARSIGLLGDDRTLLDELTEAAWQRCRIAGKGTTLDSAALSKLEPSLLRRVVRFALRDGQGGQRRDFHSAHCAAIASAIKARRGGTFHAGAGTRVILSAGKFVVKKSASGRPSVNPDAQDSAVLGTLTVPEKSRTYAGPWGEVRLQARSARTRERPHEVRSAPAGRVWLSSEILPAGTLLTLRYPRKGDKCMPSGSKPQGSLTRFMAKSGVTRDERAKALLLCRGEQVLAVLGHRAIPAFCAREGRPALEVRWHSSR